MKQKNMKKILPFLLTALLVIGLFCSLSSVLAVNDHQVFFGGSAFNSNSYTLSSPAQYGFHTSLFSTLSVPTNWYLQYTMGFYILNSSDYGYYVGLHQYYGHAQVYINPVIAGVAWGLDGQPTNFYNGVPSHLGLVYEAVSSAFGNSLNMLEISIDYNYTSGLFSIIQSNAILVQNNFSGNGFVFTKYMVQNPLGRQGIAGTVAFSMYGADNSNGTFNDPNYIGINFVSLTDGVPSGAGGSIAWESSNMLGPIGSGTDGFVGNLSLTDSIKVTATANTGYSLASFYVSNNYTGQFFPAGYYDLGGRLIASPDFTHLYAGESGNVIYTPNNPLGIGANLLGGGWDIEISDYSWNNGSVPAGYSNVGFPLILINSAHYDLVTNWESWFGGSASVIPQTAGIFTGNPINFQYWGANLTLFASFTTVNYDPNSIGAGPTATPSGFGGMNLNFGSFSTGIYMILAMIIGALLTFAGVIVLMKASSAWIIGLICLVGGLFTSLYGQPNLIGPFIFCAELIAFSVMLYSGDRRTK
jgi:hypothetical protein